MKYCMFCGSQVLDEAMFCPSCGKSLPSTEKKEDVVRVTQVEKISKPQQVKKVEIKDKEETEEEIETYVVEENDEYSQMFKELDEMIDEEVEKRKTEPSVKHQTEDIKDTKNDLEDDDEYPSKMNKTSSLTSDDDLTADEKADLEKHKLYKEEETEAEIEKIKGKGEGRKNNGRKKEARKNVDKEIEKRRLKKIEHEEVSEKENVDPDYDGYYENVRPIDFDKQKDNSSIIKVVLTALIFLGLTGGIFYLLITFFMS